MHYSIGKWGYLTKVILLVVESRFNPGNSDSLDSLLDFRQHYRSGRLYITFLTPVTLKGMVLDSR
jgi:hypothetical protein